MERHLHKALQDTLTYMRPRYNHYFMMMWEALAQDLLTKEIAWPIALTHPDQEVREFFQFLRTRLQELNNEYPECQIP